MYPFSVVVAIGNRCVDIPYSFGGLDELGTTTLCWPIRVGFSRAVEQIKNIKKVWIHSNLLHTQNQKFVRQLRLRAHDSNCN